MSGQTSTLSYTIQGSDTYIRGIQYRKTVWVYKFLQTGYGWFPDRIVTQVHISVVAARTERLWLGQFDSGQSNFYGMYQNGSDVTQPVNRTRDVSCSELPTGFIPENAEAPF